MSTADDSIKYGPHRIDSTAEPHVHNWEYGEGWGVIIGVSRCKTCGVISCADDFKRPEPRDIKGSADG